MTAGRCAEALFIAVALVVAPAACAADTVIAGGVSSASANLWPIHIGTRKGFFAYADIGVDLVFSPFKASTTLPSLAFEILPVGSKKPPATKKS
jgi:ABC-type nitrate/sulfonate/bicarbonate transport system substrate-binding protein